MPLSCYPDKIDDTFEKIIVDRLLNKAHKKNQIFASITPLSTGDIISERCVGNNWLTCNNIFSEYTLSATSEHPLKGATSMREHSKNTKSDFEWLMKNSNQLADKYKNEWIAISGNRIVAHDSDYKEVLNDVKRKRIKCPFITFLRYDEWK